MVGEERRKKIHEVLDGKPEDPHRQQHVLVDFQADGVVQEHRAERHGCRPLRGVATYEDVYKLSYLRGPSGIIVMFAQELQQG